MEPILIIPVVIIVALVIRVIAGSFDADRVHMYVKSRGWKLIDQSWDPEGLHGRWNQTCERMGPSHALMASQARPLIR